MVLRDKYAKEPWRHIGLKVPHHGRDPPVRGKNTPYVSKTVFALLFINFGSPNL